MLTLTGTVKAVMEIRQVSDSFKVREFVITDNSSQYPQHISFQLAQDKVDLITENLVGSDVTVTFNLRGREWTDPKTGNVRYFNSLDAWKIESQAAGNTPPAPSTPPADFNVAEDDDLPF